MFNEPASHFAMEFDGKLVIHASFLGIDLDWSPWFRAEHIIVSTLVPKVQMSLDQEEDYYQRILKKKPTRPGYDYKAFCYFGYAGIKHKFFGEPLPAKNPYNDGEYFLCTEEATLFELVDPKQMDTSIVTPWMLRSYFLKTGNWIEEAA